MANDLGSCFADLVYFNFDKSVLIQQHSQRSLPADRCMRDTCDLTCLMFDVSVPWL